MPNPTVKPFEPDLSSFVTDKKKPTARPKKASADLWVWSPPIPPPREGLVGTMLFNTNAFPADGGQRKVDWQNVTSHGSRMFLHSILLWLGAQKGTTCDAHAQLTRNDSSTLAVQQVDHYADGYRGTTQLITFCPDYAIIEPGEWLALTYFAANTSNPRGMAHFTATLWWKWVKP